MDDLEVTEFLAANLMGWCRNFPFTGWWIGNISVGEFAPCSKIDQALGDGRSSDTVAGKMKEKGWSLRHISENPYMQDENNRWVANYRHLETMQFIQEYGSTPAKAISYGAVKALREP